MSVFAEVDLGKASASSLIYSAYLTEALGGGWFSWHPAPPGRLLSATQSVPLSQPSARLHSAPVYTQDMVNPGQVVESYSNAHCPSVPDVQSVSLVHAVNRQSLLRALSTPAGRQIPLLQSVSSEQELY